MQRACSIVVVLIALLVTAPSAHAHPPYGIAVDGEGAVSFFDWPRARVIRVDAKGEASVVVDFRELGIKAHPHALAIDPSGRLLVAETYGPRIWIVEARGAVRLHPWCERADDGLGHVQDIEVGPRGRLHLLRRVEKEGEDRRFVLQRIEPGGVVTTLFDVLKRTHPLYGACFAIGPKGAVWVSQGNRVFRLRQGTLEVIAGAKEAGYRDGSETEARFTGCYGIAAQADGSVVVAEMDGGRIRRVAANGTVTTLVSGTAFERPYQVAVGRSGLVYVAEEARGPKAHRIRVIEGEKVRTLARIDPKAPIGDARPRNLADFLAISKANTERAPIAELAGLHPVRDWPLSLWVERAHEAREEKAWDAPLFLNGVTRLTVAEAKALAAFRGSRIFLPDLATLPAPVAEALSASHAELWLDGLTEMDVPRGRPLSRAKGHRLALRGLPELTPRAAKRLYAFDGSLMLDGVKEISVVSLLIIAQWDGYGEQVNLSLGLTALDAERAKILATCPGWGVVLDRLETLTPEAARELGNLEAAYLSLDGLETIPLELAKVMAGWKRKFLTLNGVKHVTPEVRALVEAGCEAVSWRGLESRK